MSVKRKFAESDSSFQKRRRDNIKETADEEIVSKQPDTVTRSLGTQSLGTLSRVIRMIRLIV